MSLAQDGFWFNTPREARPSRGVSFPSRSSASPPVPPDHSAASRV